MSSLDYFDGTGDAVGDWIIANLAEEMAEAMELLKVVCKALAVKVIIFIGCYVHRWLLYVG